ncbi:MAG: hypothetical protein KGJ77_01170 [Acidobacteriota bacterium]|nr:hypothetical protein [Acidobacteriota bacterium]
MSAPAAVAGHRMGDDEVAWGWVPGTCGGAGAAPPEATADPVAALEAAVLPALVRSPCLVQFSGGRDSSLVLAATLRVARREGLPEPVAHTQRFPALPETDEAAWQERVIAHLGVREWERVVVDDEVDLVGPVAGPSLERHGLLWPPMVHAQHLDLARARGGAIVDGEGGDEVLGGGRLAALAALARGLEPLRPAPLARAALGLAPAAVRRAAARRHHRALRPPWLRPGAWDALESRLSADLAEEPLDRRRALARHLRLRMVVGYLANSALLAAEHDVVACAPLLDPAVVAAVGLAGGWVGFPGRATAMTTMFGALLPAEVLRRSSKARFNRSAFNRHSRAFARAWDGSGLDDERVDAEALRRAWAEDEPNALSFALLQSAWLAAR